MLVRLSQLIWGLPLEDYVSYHGFHGSREKHGTVPRQLASAAVQRISSFAGDLEALYPMKVTQEVSLEMLHDVLIMSHDPETYNIFLYPGLASGCITLMTTMKNGEKASPFSYEYGYLCFRILLFSLGATLLSRLGDHDFKQAIKMMVDPQYDLCLLSDVFSVRVADSLIDIVPMAGQEVNCNCSWILGWSHHESHPPCDRIISPERARVLIEMLWEDRADFLKVMSRTFTPGLAVLAFLNWQYACIEKKSANANHDLLEHTNEIHHRCLLVASTSQDNLMMRVTDQLYVLNGGKNLFQKLDDSRGTLEAYVLRLSSTNLLIYGPVPIVMLSTLLEFVAPNLAMDVEDLLPSVFGATLRRLWESLRGEEFNYDPLVIGVALTFEQFKVMFKSFQERNISRPAIAKILEELFENSFFDLIASLFMLLHPDAEGDRMVENTNFNLIQTTKAMVDELSMATPRELIETHFRNYALSYIKVYYHFDQLYSCIDPKDRIEHPCPRGKHYKACLEMWADLVVILGQDVTIMQVRQRSSVCMYKQCQDPTGLSRLGAIYACPRCFISSYCSTRCQVG
ncbi:hypothetical protein RSOL_107920 [Rhizoctonia solani AG-3 Rhs1AP]|uniref:MYND-type domain-containing protein n=1 Tax=Rhizoctonia solani AG-3 Rhs1AP TaxID=1086054 RepID=X8J1X7_9AGAM|nr:hypothetical protein RSOL_107920 [Rhizoctonia solani AG-3 Rhs1AP]